MSNERTAIDTALIKLGLASQYLEVSRPSKQDVKKSSEAAKDAAEILKASLVLLDHDVYTVQEAPQEATPLFKPTGEPTAHADIYSPQEATPVPLPTLGIIDVEIVDEGNKFKVGDRVKDPDGDFGTVLRCYRTEDTEIEAYVVDCPPYGEMDWEVQDLTLVTPDDEAMAEPFPAPPKANQKKLFEERLATLGDIFCERFPDDPYGVMLKAFRPHRDAWVAAWKEDARATWPQLLAAIVQANKTDVEFTAWAPAA